MSSTLRCLTLLYILSLASAYALPSRAQTVPADTEKARHQKVQAKQIPPADMVLIPGGTIRMGIDETEIPRFQLLFHIDGPELFNDEVPKHSVKLNPYYIDRNLVTNAQFFVFTQRFANDDPKEKLARPDQHFAEGDSRSRYDDRKVLKHWVDSKVPVALENHPVTNVTWYDAVAYCQWQGKRLPTEAEWENAARGGQSPTFAWGDEPADQSRANFSESGFGTTTQVGKYPPNAYGLYDMAGNVWQFTSDEWAPYPTNPEKKPKASNDREPIQLDLMHAHDSDFLNVTTRRVIRGGSWGGAPINLWVEYRDSHPPDGAQPFVGFRCAKSTD